MKSKLYIESKEGKKDEYKIKIKGWKKSNEKIKLPLKFKYNSFKRFCLSQYPMEFEKSYVNPVTYGARVKMLRETHGLSARNLAKKCGITHRTLRKIEEGEIKKINFKYLSRFCDIFNVSYPYMLCKTDFTLGSGYYFCFPNPASNSSLLYFIKERNILALTKDEITALCSNDNPNEKFDFSTVYNGRIIPELIKFLKKWKSGVAIKINNYIYYLYYFPIDEFKLFDPQIDLAADILHSEYKYTKQYKDYIDNFCKNHHFIYSKHISSFICSNKAKLKDLLIIHECDNLKSLFKIKDHEANTNSFYLDMLYQIFFENSVEHFSNKQLLEFIYNCNTYFEENELINLLTQIVKLDNYETKTLKYLLGIIHDFMKIPENSQTEVYKGIAAYLRKATKDLENDF